MQSRRNFLRTLIGAAVAAPAAALAATFPAPHAPPVLIGHLIWPPIPPGEWLIARPENRELLFGVSVI